jgi:CDP-diacylglycerol pyrophosphatase
MKSVNRSSCPARKNPAGSSDTAAHAAWFRLKRQVRSPVSTVIVIGTILFSSTCIFAVKDAGAQATDTNRADLSDEVATQLYSAHPPLPTCSSPGAKLPCVVKLAVRSYILALGVRMNEYVLIPLTLVSGIESNLQNDKRPPTQWLPNYWYDAWFLATTTLLKGPHIALAINSADSRDQDQLHIHMCRLKQDVLKQLDVPALSDTWTGSPYLVLGTHKYDTMYIPVLGMSSNPFEMLVKGKGALERSEQMSDINVVVTDATGIRMKTGGVYLLASYGNGGAATELLRTPNCNM